MLKIEQELVYIGVYLPQQLTEEELKQIISEVAKMINANKPSDMGMLMGWLLLKQEVVLTNLL